MVHLLNSASMMQSSETTSPKVSAPNYTKSTEKAQISLLTHGSFIPEDPEGKFHFALVATFSMTTYSIMHKYYNVDNYS